MALLNHGLRKEAIEKLEKSVARHASLRGKVQKDSVALFELRRRVAREVVVSVERYVNKLANTPKEFRRSVARFRVQTDRFEATVRALELEAVSVSRIGGATGAAGAAAGVGVAALAPTAALAIATTFGTASTGTAIATLSGAAATNAALAWLGGGALAVGGGGMAGGNALLALAGPVGWGIGGVALAGSGIYLHSRNAALAEKAGKERIKVEGEIRSLRTAGREIRGLTERTSAHADGCLEVLNRLQGQAPSDYAAFNVSDKERLAALINHVRSLGELLEAEATL